jgi:hypothetical protein
VKNDKTCLHRYTRELGSEENTHLIAEQASGAKYEMAVSYPHIHIVTPSWVEFCLQNRSRVDEAAYRVGTPRKPEVSLTKAVDTELQNTVGEDKNKLLFSSHQFYLLGFEGDNELKLKIGRLIRRGLGTIYWEMNESITHLIVHDMCDDPLR